MNFREWNPARLRIAFVVFFLFTILALAFALREITNFVLVALLLTYILNPLIENCERRGLERNLAVTLLFVSVFAVVTLGLGFFGLKVYNNVTQIRVILLGEPLMTEAEAATASPLGLLPAPDATPKDPVVRASGAKFTLFRDLNGDGERQIGLIDKAQQKLEPILKEIAQEDYVRVSEVLQNSAGRGAELLAGAVEQGRGFASSLTNLVSYLLLVPIYTFFFLRHFTAIKATIAQHLPKLYREQTLATLSEIDDSLAAFFRGRLIIALIKGAITAIGLWFTGVPFGMALGLVAGLLSFVPALGPVLALSVGFCLGISEADSAGGLLLALGFVVATAEVIEAACYPLVLSGEAGLHPVALILAFLTFGQLFGFFGILLAVPIGSVARILFKRFVLPQIQALAGLNNSGPEEEPGEPVESSEQGVSEGEVDHHAQNIVERRDEGPRGEGGVNADAVEAEGNDGAEDRSVGDRDEEGKADDEAKAPAANNEGAKEDQGAADQADGKADA